MKDSKTPIFSYLLAGGGCAGLSLAYRLHLSDADFSVLLIDNNEKNQNDRTWCFWEDGEGIFESLVYRHWETVDFYGTKGKQRLDISPYRYKMIRGLDFYEYILKKLKKDDRFSFVQAHIDSFKNEKDGVILKTDKGEFAGKWLFNSAKRPPFSPGAISYLQHFMGWVVKTETNTFSSDAATLMDFRIPQVQGEARFMYVLPFSANEALIEFTVFSPTLLARKEYEQSLNAYLNEYISPGSFNVTHTEFGAIPMTEMDFVRNEGGIFHIGTAGGMAKASTGYTFMRIQKEAEQISKALTENRKPELDAGSSRFSLYDSTLLDVMANDRHQSADVFSVLFAKNHPGRVLQFLDEETNVWQELKIMSSVPLLPFFSGMLSSVRRRQTFR